MRTGILLIDARRSDHVFEKMVESFTTVCARSSPPSKRVHSESLVSEEENDWPDPIFPSEESSESDSQMGSCEVEVFYPSEDCRSDLQPDDTMDASFTGNNSLEQQSTDKDSELAKIGQLLVGTCCSALCLRHLTATDIITSKADFVTLTKSDQKLYLFNKLKEGSCESDGKVIKFFIAGKEICENAWTKIYDVSPHTLSRKLKQLACGEDPTHGNLGKKRVNTKAGSVSSWMNVYFNLIGDKMPHKNQIHLPSWESQKAIYSRYVGDMRRRGICEEEIAGISVFYKIWNEEFSNVVIPKVWTFYVAMYVLTN